MKMESGGLCAQILSAFIIHGMEGEVDSLISVCRVGISVGQLSGWEHDHTAIQNEGSCAW